VQVRHASPPGEALTVYGLREHFPDSTTPKGEPIDAMPCSDRTAGVTGCAYCPFIKAWDSARRIIKTALRAKRGSRGRGPVMPNNNTALLGAYNRVNDGQCTAEPPEFARPYRPLRFDEHRLTIMRNSDVLVGVLALTFAGMAFGPAALIAQGGRAAPISHVSIIGPSEGSAAGSRTYPQNGRGHTKSIYSVLSSRGETRRWRMVHPNKPAPHGVSSLHLIQIRVKLGKKSMRCRGAHLT